MLYFQNERLYRAENVYKDIFLGPLQPGVHKNSAGIAILISEFDDVMVKTLYSAVDQNCLYVTSRRPCWGQKPGISKTKTHFHVNSAKRILLY